LHNVGMSRLTAGMDMSMFQPSTPPVNLSLRTSIEALVRFAVTQTEADFGFLCIEDPLETLVLIVRRLTTGTNTWSPADTVVWGRQPNGREELAKVQPGSGSLPGNEIAVPILSRAHNFGVLKLDYSIPLQECANRLAALERIADALACLLDRRNVEHQVGELAVRAATLEAELADSKISERVSGCTFEATKGRASLDVITAHVANVISACRVRDELSDRVRHLEQELHKRDLLNEAKAVLQRTRGVSESEAYMQLRNASRRTRRPLADVAEAVIAEGFRELHEMSA
jgi:hypothetical protein